MQWLGLDWDEGPFYQSQRTELYRAAAKKCLANGSAFLCYCPAEKYVGGDHADDGAEGAPGPPRRPLLLPRWQTLPLPEPSRPFASKCPSAAKPLSTTSSSATREFSNDDIEDFVLLRSGQDDEEFGQPMYQLSVVVDDIDMRITHVIRGADHLSNTPKQVLLYRALEAKPPIFAHLPLILGPDRKRLSKRHGATDVSMYRDEGFLPEAFRNFLALLGWAPGGDEEFLRTTELIEKFKLEGVSRTNGVFDRAKLEWFNTQYLQKLPIEELLPQVEQELQAQRLVERRVGLRRRPRMVLANGRLAAPARPLAAGFLHLVARIFQRRFRHRSRRQSKILERSQSAGFAARNWPRRSAALPEWNHDACDHALRALCEAEGVKAGLLINATRVAIVGQAVAPPLFDTMVVLGRDRVVKRLRAASPASIASN